MIVPAFTSYGDTGTRIEARRYSGGRLFAFVSTRSAPGASAPDALLDVLCACVRSAGMTIPAGAAATTSRPARPRAAWSTGPRSKAATPIGALIAARKARRCCASSGSSVLGRAATSLGGESGVDGDGRGSRAAGCAAESWRSEEHTSELQSLAYLVCRLLLEKK